MKERSWTLESRQRDGDCQLDPGNHHLGVQNGAEGGGAVSGGIAITIAEDQTTARIGTDFYQTLNPSGDLAIDASGSFAVSSLADAATTSSGVLGLGASVVVNVSQDNFLAELAERQRRWGRQRYRWQPPPARARPRPASGGRPVAATPAREQGNRGPGDAESVRLWPERRRFQCGGERRTGSSPARTPS